MSKEHTKILLNDTQPAYINKTDKDLKRAAILFRMMSYPALVKTGSRLLRAALRVGIVPNKLIRQTLFRQFVGGESKEATLPVIKELHQSGLQAILDYGSEGLQSEAGFEASKEEFLNLLNFCSAKGIPFISIKVTALGRFALLEKRSTLGAKSGTPLLSNEENAEFERIVERLERICQAAKQLKLSVLVDAEESWIQDCIDTLVLDLMKKNNRDKPVVYNTIQFYRKNRLEYLNNIFIETLNGDFIAGFKIVRGAYMEKERERAQQMGYPSPIQDTKEDTDSDFRAGMEFCLMNHKLIALVIASHNEESNLQAIGLMSQYGISENNPHVHFSQLYGMCDVLSYNLAKSGYSVSKYVPYGPVKEVIPYLLRRAEENTSVSGQTGRELELIQTELKRRKIAKFG